ncbi:DUF3718 domain-containing protein [Rheinheimera salexigens]|uniref:DUF3718 domain-containing protein n=1 Tax=Rheinheimera salexigens TaxID=1628148 RepID=A0A1E7Q371_9GAMM|nr:DUF3718 domain-containing protein [Rheinheimera salexigens]OEY68625.1 hypothetical protein BI198_02840 [Rheinheimera salexigens]
MRLVPTLLCSVVVGFATFSSPVALADDQIAASMCDYVAADDKNRLRKVLSDQRLRLRNVYEGIFCDGNSLIRYAFINNAADVGEFIIKQLPSSAVADSGDIAWAEANGHNASALLDVLKQRAE